MNRFLWLFTDVGCAVVIIVFACVFATTAALSQAVTDIHMQFSMPDDAAFATDDYLEAAEKQADKFLKEREAVVWQQLGFQEKSFEKKYDLSIASKKKKVEDRVIYKGNGVYQTQTVVQIELSSSIHPGIQPQHIVREYLVTLRARPERRWYGEVDMNWEFIVFASGEIRQIASVEKRQFGSAEIRQFESIEKSQS